LLNNGKYFRTIQLKKLETLINKYTLLQLIKHIEKGTTTTDTTPLGKIKQQLEQLIISREKKVKN